MNVARKFIEVYDLPRVVVKWDDLTDLQKSQVLKGDACGHPSNRPKNDLEARQRLWLVDESGDVIGWRE